MNGCCPLSTPALRSARKTGFVRKGPAFLSPRANYSIFVVHIPHTPCQPPCAAHLLGCMPHQGRRLRILGSVASVRTLASAPHAFSQPLTGSPGTCKVCRRVFFPFHTLRMFKQVQLTAATQRLPARCTTVTHSSSLSPCAPRGPPPHCSFILGAHLFATVYQ